MIDERGFMVKGGGEIPAGYYYELDEKWLHIRVPTGLPMAVIATLQL